MTRRRVDEFGFSERMAAERGPRRIPPEGFPSGPEVGERLPDFELPDADGRLVRLHEDRDGHKVALVFIRSAVW